MDTGHGSSVSLRRASGLGPAMFAGLVLLWTGCMSPRPIGRGGADGFVSSEAGRFDPSVVLTRWDDLREPSVRFSLHRHWEIIAPESAFAVFDRRFSADAPVRGGIRVHHVVPQDRIRLRPVAPLLIPEPFDTVEIGLEARGSGAEIRAPFALAAEARLWVKDRNGERMSIDLGGIPRARVLRQRHLGADFLREAAFPFHLVEIEVYGFRDDVVELLLDDIVFYPQCRIPLASRYTLDMPVWPRRNARIRDHVMTTPADKGTDAYRHEVRRTGAGFLFAATGITGRAEYRMAPDGEGRVAVEFGWNGERHGRWPGVHIEMDAGTPGASDPHLYRIDNRTIGWRPGGNLRAEARLDGGGLRVRYFGGREVKRLVLAAPDLPFRRLYLPFLNDGPDGGPAVYGDGDLAAAVFPDPLASRASRLGFAAAGDPEGHPAAWAEYRPASDGRRAWVEEQVVLMVSPNMFEVLPAPPNWGVPEPGFRLEDRPWLDREWTDEDTLRRLAAFGMSEWTIPDVWPDDLEAWFASDEILPGDPGWTRDALLRDPDGHWVEGSADGVYRLKMDAVRRHARLHRGADPLPALLLPVMVSARPPWALADYDSRTEGAACFRPGVEALAGLLRDAETESGVRWVGDDASAWWYAAMLDAWQVGADRGRRLWAGPLLPVVSQVALRSHGIGVGIGRIPPAGAAAPEAWPREMLDRYLALHVAYGLALRMPPPEIGMAALSRLYHPARVLQAARAGQPVVDMAYERQGAVEPLIRSLSSGAPRDLERLYLRYANGLEVWVNGSFQDDWTVRLGADRWVLPPSGWIAAGAGALAFVARGEDGAITTGAKAGKMEFWDGDGHEGALTGAGGVGQVLVVMPESDYGELTALDVDGAGALRLAPALFGLISPASVEARDLQTGETVDAAWEEMPDGFIHIRGPARPTRYRVRTR